MNTSLSKIIELINSGNFLKAEGEIKKIYHQNPKSFDLNKMLGLCFLAQKRYNAALKCFERCYEKNKNDYEVVLNLSYLFTKVQFYTQSKDFCNKAIDINPEHPSAYQNLATTYFMLGKFADAETNATKAINLRGGFDSKLFYDSATELVKLYGDILLAQNKTDEFVTYANNLHKNTYDQNTLIKLLRVDKSLISDHYLDIVNQVLQKGEELTRKLDRNTYLSGANFILGEYYAGIDQKKSEENYIKGNQLIADMQRESLFVRQRTTSQVANFFKNFDTSIISKKIEPNKGNGLIFVIGVPRSGTTLVESILATAEDTTAGGEKSFFSLQLHQTAKTLDNLEIDLDADFFEDLGDRYLENISLQRGDSKNFIDKLPENYLFYKFIKLALPGAKFINCYRDPWDNAISLFKQNFSINVFFASSFFGIAMEYANYEYLLKCWKEIDGEDALFDVNYENLIRDKGSIIPKLWEYCGLQGQYEEEKRKKHFGYTASFQQVTKEIYDTSIKKPDFIDFKETFFKDLDNQREYWSKL